MKYKPTKQELQESLRQSENSRLALRRENEAMLKRIVGMESVLMAMKAEFRDAMQYGRSVSDETMKKLSAKSDDAIGEPQWLRAHRWKHGQIDIAAAGGSP